MAVDYKKFVFHSNRTPYGTLGEVVRTINWQGTISAGGDTIWTPEIEFNTKNVALRTYIKVPSQGAWRMNFFGDISPNSYAQGQLIQSYTPGDWFGMASVALEYTTNGVRLGLRRNWGVGPNGNINGTKTLPSRDFEIKLVMNILPSIVG